MRSDTYNYNLPKEAIAQKAFKNRDECKLLLLDKLTGAIQHKKFLDIVELIDKNSILVINNTKVIPAKLFGVKEETKGKVEILLISKNDDHTWNIFINKRTGLKAGSKLLLGPDRTLEASITALYPEVVVKFNLPDDKSVLDAIKHNGYAPLPPYIKREDENIVDKEEDIDSYQTIFAKFDGSIAAPTAGMHFTENLLKKINDKGIEIVEITMHIGPGTFKPIKTDTLEAHKMDSEYYTITETAAKTYNKAKKEGKKVIAVGTSSIRTLESIADDKGYIKPGQGSTGLFITEGYKFKAIDAIITNFHLPMSTNLVLIAAFTGRDKVLKAYQEAINQNYRFYSYGDAMFIL